MLGAGVIIFALWMRMTRVSEASDPPEVPWLEVEELGCWLGLLGAWLEAAAWFPQVGMVEFSGMCFSSARSGRRLKKTRKYDIITTPAERVEMAPLNEEDDEDEDSTVFDIKYRSGVGTAASSWACGRGVVGRFISENTTRSGCSVFECWCILMMGRIALIPS